MLNKAERKKRFDDLLRIERLNNVERVMWLSFCDNAKPKGKRFLGVIVINALGLSDAILKTHAMGINPCGEVVSFVMGDEEIKPEHFNKLLSAKQLIKYGYADEK